MIKGKDVNFGEKGDPEAEVEKIRIQIWGLEKIPEIRSGPAKDD